MNMAKMCKLWPDFRSKKCLGGGGGGEGGLIYKDSSSFTPQKCVKYLASSRIPLKLI